MTNAHTEYVLEHYGLEVALRFHLESRCYPPAGHLYEAAKAAIAACSDGDPYAEIDLPESCTFRGRDTCPAIALASNFRLDPFVSPVDYD